MIPASGHSVRTAATFLLSCTLWMTCVPSPAIAAPATPEISEKQAQAAAAQADLDRMRAELEGKVEEYNAVTEAVEQTELEIDETRRDLDLATQELQTAQDVLAKRVSGIYRHGGAGVLDIFLGVRDFDDFVTRFELLRRIGASDAATVESVQQAKARVEAAKRALEQRHAEQLTLQKQARDRAAAIESEVSRQQAYVARLDSDVKRLIVAEEERQRKAAEQRAREAAIAAAAAAARRATPTPVQSPGGQSGDAGGSSGPESGPVIVPSGSVVDIALQYLGVPYVWGGSSPSGFDCSGLVQYVYRQVGVSLPRTSQSQFRVGQHIPPDRVDLLLPGDLVFFGYDGDPQRVHHVGIYVGGGNYVHAPYTGTVVRVNSLTARIESNRDYVGASRI